MPNLWSLLRYERLKGALRELPTKRPFNSDTKVEHLKVKRRPTTQQGVSYLTQGTSNIHIRIRAGAKPNDPQPKDNTVSIVKLLLAHKADPNIRLKQEKPAVTSNEISLASGGGTDVQRMRSPEERAMAVETAKLLIERGSNVSAVGQYGWTALHAAAYQGLNDVIELLASKGAKVDEMDTFGQTPLSISLSVLTRDIGARRLQIPRRYRKDVSDLLLNLGATPLAQSGVDVVLQRSGDLND